MYRVGQERLALCVFAAPVDCVVIGAFLCDWKNRRSGSRPSGTRLTN